MCPAAEPLEPAAPSPTQAPATGHADPAPRRVGVLLVSADLGFREPALKAFGAAAARLVAPPLVLDLEAVADGATALARASADGTLHAVLVDATAHAADLVDPCADPSADRSIAALAAMPAGATTAPRGAALVQALHALRPELSLYLLVGDDGVPEVAADLDEALAGCFVRSDGDAEGWLRIVLADLAEQAATPFFDRLRAYVAQAKDAWHTPGHAGGDGFRRSAWVADFHDFVGEEMLRADLSVSVPELDSLLHPTGVIAQAQDLAARAFGARRTFFATNGTSTANKVIFQTLLAPGDKLLLDRNCHKSVHHGVILSGARPVYLDASLNRRFGIFGPVPRADVLAAIAAHPDAKALILTSCTYDGLRVELAPIVAAAHAAGIKVIVDEAWYGHARFHPELRPTALEAGADYVTQSTHKVLSAFSQASMIHVNDADFDEHVFRENFNMHASTSPQYALIASLDVARKQAVMEGYALLSRSLGFARELRERIGATGVFRVLELDELITDAVRADGIRLDPTKLTIAIDQSGWDADALREDLLVRHDIQVEKNTHNTLTLLLTMATTRSKVLRLQDALARIARGARSTRIARSARSSRMDNPPSSTDTELPVAAAQVPAFTRLACLPRDAFYAEGERLPLFGADGRINPALVGRVCCDQIVPYPPGIPVLVAGQEVSAEALDYLAALLRQQTGIDLHGLVGSAHSRGGVHLRVLSAAEAARYAGAPV